MINEFTPPRTANGRCLMSKLTALVRPDQTVDSLVIAERLGVKHRSTYRLIKAHSERFEEFGYLRFQIADKSKSGREKYALLNEDQTYFLLTLSKNSEKVVALKQDLVKAFSKLRKAEERRASLQWQQERALGKYSRRKATNAIQRFVAYAKEQGSSGADHYYTLFTRLVHSTVGVESRDAATEDQLAMLDVAEATIEKTLDESMISGTPYKLCYQLVKDRMCKYGELI